MADLERVGVEDKKLWVPVPGVAVPVRVVMEVQSELDLLAQTILRLLEIRPRSVDELSQKLGLERGRDLVVLALQELEDRYLIEALDEGSGVFDSCSEEQKSRPGSTIQPAWAFISLIGQPRVLPELWMGTRLPQSLSKAVSRDRNFSEEFRTFFGDSQWRSGLGQKNLDRILQGLARRSDIILSGDKKEKGANGEDEGERLGLPWIPDQNMHYHDKRLRKIEIDSVRAERRLLEWVPLWSQVEFLPRIAAPATAIFRDLQVKPKAGRTRSINVEIEDWLKSEGGISELHTYVKNLASSMREEFSLVLKLAGIESSEKLERVVDEHIETLSRESGLRAPAADAVILGRGVDEKIRDAWRSLMISRQNDRHIQQARYHYALVAESLAQALREQGMAELERWKSVWDKLDKGGRRGFQDTRKKVGWRSDRLGMVGLTASELGSSLRYLEQAMQRLSRVSELIANAQNQGAGNSLSLWLLPIFLAGDDEAQAYAKPIREALAMEPMLFERLDALIKARNEVFHDRAEQMERLDRLDRWSFTSWAALEAGYRRVEESS